ncbi:hypothetical protein L6164_007577 [Bauhinia variegata]|uniref:Uncharacterized protein n=1 Tax=Bauhinia variegata TaxID=167791 RepID=A0ACB9PFI8_BAUVA|nr:hypothetical protein L6164_007577 [Bauhinia variegata]
MDILKKFFGFTCSKRTSLSANANQSSPSTQIEELCYRFPLPLLQKLTGNFEKGRLTGVGALCDVYKACINIQGEFHEIAIKKWRSNSGQSLIFFKNEIQMLCQLRHPNLIRLIGFYEGESLQVIVLEYMPNGSLYDQLLSKNKEPLSWKIRLQICIGTARGLHYLHAGAKRTIFHRDVQPVNILLDKDFVPKLANFFISLKGPHSMSKPARPKNLDEVIGTFGFIAPEYNRDCIFTDKCDVYSFGMVLFVIVCALMPLSIFEKMGVVQDQEANDIESDPFEVCQSIAKRVCKFLQEGKAYTIIDPFLIGKIAPRCWKTFLAIAESCLLEDPSERPMMGEVEVELEHALALQEEADATNPVGDYSLLSI